MSRIRVGLADDNRELIELLKEYVDHQADMEVAGWAYNGQECINMVVEKSIDVLVLDIIMPHIDGLAVLQKIKDLRRTQPPKIIMLTAFGQEDITKKSVELGASYYILKPFDMESLVSHIRGVHEPSAAAAVSTAEEVTYSPLIEEQAGVFLKEMGIPLHIRGYMYLKDAIVLVKKDPDYLKAITKSLYPQIALLHNTTASRVERSIRHAIEVCWAKEEKEKLDAVFAGRKDAAAKPSNSEFIAVAADQLSSAR
ncbi:sporulation transcription factor Spo0A [Sinobaca sp. H24]|uniref:sporulation transcription factor Spo0A n=1 Tax=Sinobaca sp. H24 TaxID=2923376 RepID=UPI00207951B2|nr:sporulation transcription factor Spo0A [Sinobaca sp. H24]